MALAGVGAGSAVAIPSGLSLSIALASRASKSTPSKSSSSGGAMMRLRCAKFDVELTIIVSRKDCRCNATIRTQFWSKGCAETV